LISTALGKKKCMSVEKASKTQAPEGGEPLLDLPGPLLLKVLGRVSIPELRRLLRGHVSPMFFAAIKAVLLEIARKAAKKSLDRDEKGTAGALGRLLLDSWGAVHSLPAPLSS
jgi:hypothetical protein